MQLVRRAFGPAKGMLAEEDKRAALEAGGVREGREQVAVGRFEGG